jgi:hypothetical protein
MGGRVWRWAGSAPQSRTEDRERGIAPREASWLTVDDRPEREEGIYGARRRGRIQSAETPKTLVMSIVVSCGNRNGQRWGAELDFGSRESFDDFHRPSALGANPKMAQTGGGDLWLGLWC